MTSNLPKIPMVFNHSFGEHEVLIAKNRADQVTRTLKWMPLMVLSEAHRTNHRRHPPRASHKSEPADR